jgi:hypothetical protein
MIVSGESITQRLNKLGDEAEAQEARNSFLIGRRRSSTGGDDSSGATLWGDHGTAALDQLEKN